VDFARYDRDGDGTIETHELGVVIIGAHPPQAGRDMERFPETCATCGATRSPAYYGGCFEVDGVNFCADVSGIGEGTSIANAAHELFHLLGAGIDNDIYGGGNGHASLMGATILGMEDQPERFHLDAWHKMRAGWNDPVVRPILPEVPPASAHLVAPGIQSSLFPLTFPVLFFDPRRSDSELMLVEHRRKSGFDVSVDDEGVAVWLAKVDRTLNVFDTPREVRDPATGRLMWDRALMRQTLWVLGAPELRGGLARFWREEHGEFAPRWYPVAVPGAPVAPEIPSGLRLRVGPARANGLDVEWRTGDLPFLPRIDQIRRRDASYEMTGDFGVQGTRVVWLEPPGGGGGGRAARIEAWQADVVRWTVPSDLPAGPYIVRVYSDDRRSGGGTRYPLTVER
jgi:M6 family metalloprotease-like protein